MTKNSFGWNQVSGTDASAALAGSSTRSIGAGGSATFLAAAAFAGSTGIRYVNGGATVLHQWNLATPNNNLAVSILVKIPSGVPPVEWSWIYLTDASNARVAQLEQRPSGNIYVNDAGNNLTTLLTAAQASSLAGQWIRFELVLKVGSPGTSTFKAYNTSGTQVGSTGTPTTLGANPIAKIQTGSIGSGANSTIDLDNFQFDDGATAEIGPLVANSTPPTVNAGSNQTASASQAVSVSATASAANGDTIASYAWTVVDAYGNTGATLSFPALSNASTATASFTTSATPGRYTLRCTVTDSSGNTNSDTTRVFVPSTTGAPIEVTSNSGWSGGVTNVVDASDATYDESGAPGSASVLVLRLSPLTPATSGFSLNVRSLVQAVGGTQQVELLEGGVVRKNWGALGPGTSYADQTLTLSNAEMATIGSWNELDLRLTQV